EAQEDSESISPAKSDREHELDRTATCNSPNLDGVCEKPIPRRRAPARPADDEQPSVPDTLPSGPPDMSRTLKADYLNDNPSPWDLSVTAQVGLTPTALKSSPEDFAPAVQSQPRMTPDSARNFTDANLYPERGDGHSTQASISNHDLSLRPVVPNRSHRTT